MLLAGPDPNRAERLAGTGERLALAAAFAVLAVRYWLAVFPRTALQIRRLRARAAAIPDPTLRSVALAALAKRGNLEGAAAFAALVPRSARANTTVALVAFQSIYNYADTLAEQTCADARSGGERAHAALLLALSTRADAPPLSTETPDGAYLLSQVEDCRRALRALPSFDRVTAPALLAATQIGMFQSHNSGPPKRFERWASARSSPSRLSWWESASAAGSSLTVHALIAAAAAPGLDEHDVHRVQDAYAGPIGALHSLLDSLIDESEDAQIGQASLIGFYPSRAAAATAMGELARNARAAARALPGGRRHTVLLCAMASLYLSDPQARTTRAAPVSAAVLTAIGALAKPALALFAMRRLAARVPARRSPADSAHAKPEQPAGACAHG